tara:strand:- start:251 stop:910 length:660 start_codon:yes stop_codon:yes gene_type:complete
MKKIHIITITLLVGFSNQALSQITQIEYTPSNTKTDFSYFSIQPVAKNNTLSLSTIAFFQKFYKKKEIAFEEVGVQTTGYWNFSESVSIGPTLYFNSVVGFSEKVTLIIIKKTGKLTFVINPSMAYLNSKKTFTAELFMQMQFMQPLKKDWSFLAYTNLFTNWGGINEHLRSYQYLRIGLSKKNNQFGFSFNSDVYGIAPILKMSAGVFFRKIIVSKNN